MKVIIRIAGRVKIKKEIEQTLQRLRLGKKYTCVLMSEKDNAKRGMLTKVHNVVAYGDIEKGVLTRLIEKRGKLLKKGGKINAEKIAQGAIEGKKIEDLGIKSFFRLHPPRGGLKSSKRHFPKGILGNHKEEINKLIEKML